MITLTDSKIYAQFEGKTVKEVLDEFAVFNTSYKSHWTLHVDNERVIDFVPTNEAPRLNQNEQLYHHNRDMEKVNCIYITYDWGNIDFKITPEKTALICQCNHLRFDLEQKQGKLNQLQDLSTHIFQDIEELKRKIDTLQQEIDKMQIKINQC